jgi:hypothetical protein
MHGVNAPVFSEAFFHIDMGDIHPWLEPSSRQARSQEAEAGEEEQT